MFANFLKEEAEFIACLNAVETPIYDLFMF